MNDSLLSHSKETITLTRTTRTTTIAIVAAMVSLGVPAAVVGFTVSQPAYAQLVKDPGASFFAPGEEPQRPGWDPNGAPEDAPGVEAEIAPPPCVECVVEFTPGQEGLEAGIIGPE